MKFVDFLISPNDINNTKLIVNLLENSPDKTNIVDMFHNMIISDPDTFRDIYPGYQFGEIDHDTKTKQIKDLLSQSLTLMENPTELLDYSMLEADVTEYDLAKYKFLFYAELADLITAVKNTLKYRITPTQEETIFKPSEITVRTYGGSLFGITKWIISKTACSLVVTSILVGLGLTSLYSLGSIQLDLMSFFNCSSLSNVMLSTLGNMMTGIDLCTSYTGAVTKVVQTLGGSVGFFTFYKLIGGIQYIVCKVCKTLSGIPLCCPLKTSKQIEKEATSKISTNIENMSIEEIFKTASKISDESKRVNFLLLAKTIKNLQGVQLDNVVEMYRHYITSGNEGTSGVQLYGSRGGLRKRSQRRNKKKSSVKKTSKRKSTKKHRKASKKN